MVKLRQSLPSPQRAINYAAESLLFLFLFLVFEGYKFGVGNQLVFLPVIESLKNYPHLALDFGVSARAFYHPFFNLSMAWLNYLIPLPFIFFTLQTALIFLLYATTRRLAAFFFDSPAVYWFGTLLLFLWAQQGLDDNVLWTNRLEAQYLAWPWILTAAITYLSGHWGLTGLWVGLVCVFHFPLGVISGIIFSALALLPEDTPRIKNMLRLWAGGAILALPVFLYSLKGIFTDHFLIGPAFIPFAALRNSHHMDFNLRLAVLFAFLAVIPYSVLWISKLRSHFSETQLRAIARLARLQTVLIVFGAAQYADYYLHVGILSRLQFLRLLPLIYLTGVLFAAYLFLKLLQAPTYWPRLLSCFTIFLIGPRLITYQSLRENWIYILITLVAMTITFLLKHSRFKNIGLLSLVLFFPLAWCTKTVSLSPQSNFSFHEAPFLWNAERQSTDPWVDICQKTGRSIPKSDLVLSPPYMNGFVYFSKRKTFVEFKSNGAHKETYLEWLKRLTLAIGGEPLNNCSGMNCLDRIKRDYNQLEPAQIDKIVQLYGAAYFVTESPKRYPYEQLYANGSYKLYQLTHQRQTQSSSQNQV